uniref:Protein-S-isoprenylcysteine O-methyltransferase n=2 Tax=Sarcophilus harrisii TaxID=9305 RepID=A0A7N4V1L8_SARHA
RPSPGSPGPGTLSSERGFGRRSAQARPVGRRDSRGYSGGRGRRPKPLSEAAVRRSLGRSQRPERHGSGRAGLGGAPQPGHLPAGRVGGGAAAAHALRPAGPHRAGAVRGGAERAAAAALPPAGALPGSCRFGGSTKRLWGTGEQGVHGRWDGANLAQFLIAIRACFLGFVFGCGLLLSFSQSSWNHFGWYMCSLSLFHYSEYLVTAVNNPKSLSLDSFLLNHSLEYTVAAVSSWIEFTVENYFWPEMKQIVWLSVTGLLMVVFGECLRKAAMFTAGSNFNHVVQNEKSETHTLVTSGVYAWFRHPSYVGWFYWSIGTQVMLANPICGIAYALTVWRFFRDRTEEEEISLIHFFGEEYLEYKKKVPTGLPFIKGVKVEL